MLQKLGHLTVLVNDYDEALDFYTQKMGFEKLRDVPFGEGQRWLTVAPPEQKEMAIVFVKADTPEKKKLVGQQAADHVFLTLETDDVQADYKKMKDEGVQFLGEPRSMPWGTEVVFEDLYGNRFDLIEVAEQ